MTDLNKLVMQILITDRYINFSITYGEFSVVSKKYCYLIIFYILITWW